MRPENVHQGIVSLVSGLLFGAGLVLSGMVNPEKVLAFLDLGAIPQGGWDPSLAFVMGGALLVGFPAFALVRRRAKPLLAGRFQLPEKTRIDGALLLGSALFGIGWGLVGFCPGPAIAALGLDGWKAPLFILAMLCGMALKDRIAPSRAAARGSRGSGRTRRRPDGRSACIGRRS
jgi:uncharacterized membrane protein YedE/YeeE